MPDQKQLFKASGPYWRWCPNCGRPGFWQADEPLCPKCMTRRGGYVDEADRERVLRRKRSRVQ